MPENLYQILEVDADATLEQIKSAYRNKAKLLHPDHFHGGNAPFRALQEAYEVLCDPARRQRYDKELARAQRVRPTASRIGPSSHRRTPPAEPLVPTDRSTGRRDVLFSDPFAFPGEGRLQRQRAVSYRPGTGQAEEIHVEVSLSRDEALRGGHIRLLVPLEFICPTCGGQGHDWFFACPRCFGSGVLRGESPVNIAFPARIADGSTARVALNRAGMRDLVVKLHFRVSSW